MSSKSKPTAGAPRRESARLKGSKGGKQGSQRYGAAHFRRIGSLGGKAWAESLSVDEMRQHAIKAARARWGKPKRKARKGSRAASAVRH